MKIKIQAIHFDADKKLVDFIEQKLTKLKHFYHDIVESEVFLKLERSGAPNNKITEIKIHSPGKTLFAKEQCNSFEEATDHAVQALEKQIIRHKEKIRRGM